MPYQYSVILGNLGNTRDRFCSAYKDNRDTRSMLRMAAGIPHVEGIELVGTWDVTPANAHEMQRELADAGKACVSIIPDLFGDPDFARGSYSNANPSVRRRAIDYTLQMADVARKLGCGLLNIWPGQDGFDYLLCTDYDAYRGWFAEALHEIASKSPDLRLAIEYKPKEPRCFSLAARMSDTLLVCQEVGLPNVGVCIDTGHAYVAGESVGESIALASRAGRDLPGGSRLFHLHFNDNHGTWDDDQIVGTVHSTTYIETLYWLKRTGYAGWLSMDQYPYREDAAAAIGESIAWLRRFEQIVDSESAQIDSLIKTGDPIATSRLLRRALLGSV